MKITNPLLTKALGLFGATLIRGWTTTLDYRIVYQDPTVDPVHPRCRPRALYILWHEYLICPLGVRGRNMSVLISQHRDGELITRVLRHLGFKVIRGSSTRGGIAAIKKVVRGWGGGQKSAEHATSIREPASDNPSPGANACGFTSSSRRGYGCGGPGKRHCLRPAERWSYHGRDAAHQPLASTLVHSRIYRRRISSGGEHPLQSAYLDRE